MFCLIRQVTTDNNLDIQWFNSLAQVYLYCVQGSRISVTAETRWNGIVILIKFYTGTGTILRMQP